MTTPLFITSEELQTLTGFVLKDKQIAVLRTMGIAFRINGHGRPVVTRSAVEGITPTHHKEPAPVWTPAVLQGGRKGV